MAQEKLSKEATQHFHPSSDVKVLDYFQLVSWKQTDDARRSLAVYWMIRFYGKAKRISRLPPEYAPLKPPEIASVLYHVLVDTEGSNVNIHWVSPQNELWANGRWYRW